MAVQKSLNERNVRAQMTSVDGQMARLIFAEAGSYFAATLSKMAIQKFVGLIGPMAIGATDARLTVHLVTYWPEHLRKNKNNNGPMRMCQT